MPTYQGTEYDEVITTNSFEELDNAVSSLHGNWLKFVDESKVQFCEPLGTSTTKSMTFNRNEWYFGIIVTKLNGTRVWVRITYPTIIKELRNNNPMNKIVKAFKEFAEK